MGVGLATAAAIGMLLIITPDRAQAGEPPPRTATCVDRADVSDHIRPLGCEAARAIAKGLTRSAAFRQLVDRIATLGGIVYVQPGQVVNPASRRVLDGALLHRVSRAGAHRLLWVQVLPASDDRAVIVLAHELQHAIEVLESNASTEAEIDALFERIGTTVGAGTTETNAAVEVERIVRRELRAGM